MSRRRPPAPSSLDLLLDAICNTFGCIVLLAIIIVVLLRHTTVLRATGDGPNIRAEWLELLARRDSAISDRNHLRQILHSLSEHMPLSSADVDTLAHRLHTLTARLHELLGKKQQAEAAFADLQRQVAQIEHKKQQLDKELQSEEAELEKIAIAIRAEQSRRARSARLPYERPTAKDRVALVVRFDRLYVWHKYDGRGNRLGLNTADFVVVEVLPFEIRTAPKPYAGVPIAKGNEKAIENCLRRFDPQQQVLDIAIWEDSFDSFQLLKQVMVDLGFEYRLVLMAEGQAVVDRGGTDSLVQ